MAVPKRKVSKSRRDKRSTGKGLVKKNVMIDQNGKAFLSHIKPNIYKIAKRQARLDKKNQGQEQGG